jgi:hypothetical protein
MQPRGYCRKPAQAAERIYRKFQFHTGSIKRIRRVPRKWVDVEFQFHTGSIKRMPFASTVSQAAEDEVSIPYWFD